MKQILWLTLLFLPSDWVFGQKATFTKINEGCYIHTTYRNFGGVNYPSNGLVVATENEVWLVDTGWDEAQGKQIRKWVKKKFKQKLKRVIITHAHQDRIGGIAEINTKKVKVMALAETLEKSKAYTAVENWQTIATDFSTSWDGLEVKFLFPGAAHAPDNLVVYFPKWKLLFGGCMLKGSEAESLGNVLDADLENWPKALRNLENRFPEIDLVIPGHGAWAGKELIEHTRSLLKSFSKQ